MQFIRRIATPTTIATSLLVVATGLWMFFIGKVKLLEEIHSKTGLVFVVAMVLHIFINFNPFKRHLKTRESYFWAGLALIIGVGFAVFEKEEEKGPPASTIFRKLEQAKLQDLAQVLQVNADEIIKKMQADGLTAVESQTSISAIAEKNHRRPKELLIYFK